MPELNIEALQKLCDDKSVIWSVHALKRLQERGIYRDDVFNAIHTGKIIEQYPDSYPYPACLVLGVSAYCGRLQRKCCLYSNCLFSRFR